MHVRDTLILFLPCFLLDLLTDLLHFHLLVDVIFGACALRFLNICSELLLVLLLGCVLNNFKKFLGVEIAELSGRINGLRLRGIRS